MPLAVNRAVINYEALSKIPRNVGVGGRDIKFEGKEYSSDLSGVEFTWRID